MEVVKQYNILKTNFGGKLLKSRLAKCFSQEQITNGYGIETSLYQHAVSKVLNVCFLGYWVFCITNIIISIVAILRFPVNG